MVGRCKKRAAIILTALAGLMVFGWGAGVAGAAESQKKSITAAFVMCFRAVAAQDPDPKTRNPDYLAEKIVDLEKMREGLGFTLDFAKTVEKINQDELWNFYYTTVRTKHIDALLQKELKAGVKQVVIMGAGYDTRGYRFYKDFPKVKFFEVDLPAMTADKQKRVKSKLSKLPNNVIYAPIDFDTQKLGEVLAKVGYQKNEKTMFIWEGVVMYLDAPAIESTLRFIATNSAPGSSVVFDYLPPSVLDGTYKGDPYAQQLADFVASLGEPFKFGIDPAKSGDFLEKQGLKQSSNLGHDELVRRYMTSSNGKPFGRVPKFFWITQAKVPGGK